MQPPNMRSTFVRFSKGAKVRETMPMSNIFSDEAPRGSGTHGWAIRDHRYKLVEVVGERQMLFDLELDPFEQKNLLLSHDTIDMKNKASELRAAFKDLRG